MSQNSYGIQYVLNIVCIAPEGRPYAFNLQHPDEKGVKDTGWQSQEPGSSPGPGEDALGASARDLRKCANQDVGGTVGGNNKMRLFNICDPPKTGILLQRGAHSD